MIATTAVEPLLTADDLTPRLTPETTARLGTLTLMADGISRLRVRDLEGHVQYSSDGSGFSEAPDDEILEALAGETEVMLTRLNSDENDVGPVGEEVVEVYRPLLAGATHEQVGVLEIYLPYAPIAADIEAGLGDLYRNLVVGLAVLYLVLAGLALATMRRLRQHAAENQYLAEHDLLTGLPNRRLFQRTIAEMTARGQYGAVALVDLDRFKEVNDSLGHQHGDLLLAALGARLAADVRPGDLVARIGGDEFGVVLTRVTSEAEARTALERLGLRLAESIEIDGLPLSAEASIGFALFPDDGEDPDTLMQRADISMYVAKGDHSGVVRYDAALDDYDPHRLAVVGELRRALRENELVLHFQPKVRLDDGTITSVEALIRWQHPTRGLLMPDDFLPVAEQTGLIDDLTTWVIDSALTQSARWSGMGRPLSVAVNVSARNLCRPTFAAQVIAQLAAHGADPSTLLVEITETALMSDIERALANLAALTAHGVHVSLDDFGKGQTSLGYLYRLPLYELKIDRAFVTNMDTDVSHAAIVRSVVDLAHDLGFRVVAEGVEDEPTLDRLRSLGCDYAQGYFITRPQTFDSLTAWLEARRALAPAAR